MKKNILVQVCTRTETRTRIIPASYDADGNLLAEAREEEYEVEVPVMEAQNVETTAEEIAELEASQPPDERTYSQRVEDYIRERYTISDELAILRQRDTKPEEFAAYNAYAEECKERARWEVE